MPSPDICIAGRVTPFSPRSTVSHPSGPYTDGVPHSPEGSRAAMSLARRTRTFFRVGSKTLSLCRETYGSPLFVPSNHRSKWPVIQYQSRRWNNIVLEFSFKGVNPRNPEVKHYRCISCHQLNKKKESGEKIPIAHLTHEKRAMMTDPDNPATPHSCQPEIDAPAAKVLANCYMMEVRTEVGQSRKHPRESFDNAMLSVEERFTEQSSDVHNAIRKEMVTGYGFAAKRRALSRNHQFCVLKGNTVDTILAGLQITKDMSPFLQFQDNTEGRRMLIFFTDKDLDALQNAWYRSTCLETETSNTIPEFHNPGQLYTLHAVVNGEVHPSCTRSCRHWTYVRTRCY